MRRRALVAVAIAGLGCDPGTTEPPGPPPTVMIRPATQWSGGSFTVRSAYFSGRTVLPVMLAGTDTLALSRVDDTTLASRIPLGPSGTVIIALAQGRSSTEIGSIVRVGYRQTQPLVLPLAGELYGLNLGGHPVVFGFPDPSSDAMASIDLVTGLATVYDSIVAPGGAVRGMSPTESTGVFVVANQRHANRLERWQLFPSVQFIDTVNLSVAVPRHVARLSPHVWLQTDTHASATVTDTLPSGSNVIRYGVIEEVNDVFPAPDGSRTAVTAAAVLINVPGRFPGMPVYDNATGDTAYTLPLSGVRATTFSNDGSRLFAVGDSVWYTDGKLVAVNATTGAVLAWYTLPDTLSGVEMAHDPIGRSLVLSVASDSSMAVYVLDDVTLAVKGILPAPAVCPFGRRAGNCFMGAIAVDIVGRKVHLVDAGQSHSYVFDLLP